MKISTLKVLSTPNKIRLWLLVLLVGLITLASYWILEIVRSHNDDNKPVVRSRLDYFVENFNFVKMLPNGQSKYRVVGAKLVHYPNDDHAEVTLPVMTNLDPTQPKMTVRAERGIINNIANRAENEVHLYDNVVINRPKNDDSEHLQLNTDYLLTYPDKSTMETNLAVEIISGDTVTTGVGMRANNANQQMHILKNVYSIVPPRVEQKNTAIKK